MPNGDVAVVIPAKDEAQRIRATVRAAAELPGVDLVVVVDDGSADGTAAVARERRRRGHAAHPQPGQGRGHGDRRGSGPAAGPARGPEAAAPPAVPGRRSGRLGRLRRPADPARAQRRGGHDHRRLLVHGQAGRARRRGRAVQRGHPPGHRLVPGPAAERAALPDPGRVRGGPAAGRGVRGGDRAHHRPGPPGPADHRGRGPAGAPGHRHRLRSQLHRARQLADVARALATRR